jgi:hypothetical protein
MEVLVPLFDAFPLRTRKAREFPIWRELAQIRYRRTLFRSGSGRPLSNQENIHIDSLISQLRAIRHFI